MKQLSRFLFSVKSSCLSVKLRYSRLFPRQLLLCWWLTAFRCSSPMPFTLDLHSSENPTIPIPVFVGYYFKVYPAYICTLFTLHTYVHCTASIVFCCVLNKQISISQAFELRLSKMSHQDDKISTIHFAGEVGTDELCDSVGDCVASESASWATLPHSSRWWQSARAGGGQTLYVNDKADLRERFEHLGIYVDCSGPSLLVAVVIWSPLTLWNVLCQTIFFETFIICNNP